MRTNADEPEAASAPSTAAERMRRYRKRKREAIKFQRAGMQHVQVELHVTEVDALVQMRFLKEDDRHDPVLLQSASREVALSSSRNHSSPCSSRRSYRRRPETGYRRFM